MSVMITAGFILHTEIVVEFSPTNISSMLNQDKDKLCILAFYLFL